METCHFDPKEDKFLDQKQGCIFEKIKICWFRVVLSKKSLKLGGEFFSSFYPIVDWPCQDFTQGSTREQPSGDRPGELGVQSLSTHIQTHSLVPWHGMTCDPWHVKHGGGWTFSPNFSSPALTVWEWDRQCLKDSELKDDLIN